jgi:cytochrome c oxidase cbb3-type subunit 4
MSLQEIHAIASALWVVWFFVLFGGILAWVLRPGTHEQARRNAEIPFRNDPN